jgi:hypothetical protein
MFTHKLFTIFIALTLSIVALTGTAFADSPDTVTRDANTFISELDNLRQLGQVEAVAAQASRAQQLAVFDHSGQLNTLRNQFVAVKVNRSGIVSANDFATHLNRLRTMGHNDANTFVAQLDHLRQLGGQAATARPGQVANAHVSQLDRLRQLGQAEAVAARNAHLRQIAVFDHSGQLSALHNQMIIRQNRDTSIATANDFATHLARLQAMGYTDDANTFVTQLDQLRQMGSEANQTPSQLAVRY